MYISDGDTSIYFFFFYLENSRNPTNFGTPNINF